MKGLSLARSVSAALGGLLLVPLVTAAPVAAVEVVTPYPAVAVEPGETSTFDLEITSPETERVNLRVADAPDGWGTNIRGGGREISAVSVTGGESAEAQLDVRVPEDAGQGSHNVTIDASAGSGSASLRLTLNIVEQAAEAFELTTDFPALEGSATDTFQFDLTLANRSSQEATFSLAAAGPEGWDVQASPSTQQQAATVSVDAGGTSTINVEATPPEDVAAGDYEIGVQASGEGQTLESTLDVTITEATSMTVNTANERLNASGSAGDTGTVQLVITNDGNAPLQGVELSSTPPSDWEVEFEPSTVDIPAGQTAPVTARITPAGDAIAGDYMVTLTATGAGSDQSVEIRYTVETSGWWGLVAVLVIVAALAALIGVYRKYGRR